MRGKRIIRLTNAFSERVAGPALPLLRNARCPAVVRNTSCSLLQASVRSAHRMLAAVCDIRSHTLRNVRERVGSRSLGSGSRVCGLQGGAPFCATKMGAAAISGKTARSLAAGSRDTGESHILDHQSAREIVVKS